MFTFKEIDEVKNALRANPAADHGFLRCGVDRSVHSLPPTRESQRRWRSRALGFSERSASLTSWMTLVALTANGFPKELRVERIDASGLLRVIRSSFHDVLQQANQLGRIRI